MKGDRIEMRHDFSKVEDAESFLVPEGTYLCRVAEVITGSSKDGSERWRMRLEGVEGERVGRTLAWDSITWSDRGLYRVKAVLAALGFDVSGQLELEATGLVDRRAIVELREEAWEDPLSGRTRRSMRVPYLGYERAPERGAAWDGPIPDGSAVREGSVVAKSGTSEEEDLFGPERTPF